MACLVGGLQSWHFYPNLPYTRQLAAPVTSKGGAVRDAVNPAHTFLNRHSEAEIPLKPSLSQSPISRWQCFGGGWIPLLMECTAFWRSAAAAAGADVMIDSWYEPVTSQPSTARSWWRSSDGDGVPLKPRWWRAAVGGAETGFAICCYYLRLAGAYAIALASRATQGLERWGLGLV